MKKLAIVGASHFVNRMFEACGNYQWAREFLKNASEAGATKVGRAAATVTTNGAKASKNGAAKVSRNGGTASKPKAKASARR